MAGQRPLGRGLGRRPSSAPPSLRPWQWSSPRRRAPSPPRQPRSSCTARPASVSAPCSAASSPPRPPLLRPPRLRPPRLRPVVQVARAARVLPGWRRARSRTGSRWCASSTRTHSSPSAPTTPARSGFNIFIYIYSFLSSLPPPPSQPPSALPFSSCTLKRIALPQKGKGFAGFECPLSVLCSVYQQHQPIWL